MVEIIFLKNLNFFSCCVVLHQDFCKLFLSPVTSLAYESPRRKGEGVVIYFTAEAAQYGKPSGVHWANLSHPGY